MTKQIWRIAYPILVSSMMTQVVGMIDTAFLGRVGEVELGASALGSVFYICLFVIGMGFGMGAQILMARRNGEGNQAACGPIFYHNILFLLLIAAGLFTLILLGARPVLALMVQSPAVLDATDTYLEWRVLGMFPAYVAISFRSFYVATTDTRLLTWNAMCMVLANVVLDWMLIFGHCGLPQMGVAGAAIASVGSEVVSMLYYMVYTRLRTDYRRFGLHVRPRFSGQTLRRILSLSSWTMVQDFMSLATWFMFFLAMEHLGESELAVSNILRQLSGVPFMIVSAFSATALTLVGNMLGAGRTGEVPAMLRRVVRLCFLAVAPVVLVFGVMPEVCVRFFTDDEALVQAAILPLWVLIGSYVFTAPGQVLLRAVSGVGRTRMSFFIETASILIYIVYVAVVIFHWRAGLAAGWASEYVYNGLIFIFSLIYFMRGKWATCRI